MKLSGLILIVLSMLCVNNSSYATYSNKRIHKTMKQTQQQMKFVKKLLNVSSAAKKIKASEDVNVQSLYRAAKDLYRKALVNIDDENADAAAESLFYATEMMFRAVKLAGKQKVVNDNDYRLFELRLKSVNALLDALQRIGKIKGVADKTDKVKSVVDAEIAKAKALIKTGQPFSARKVIDKAYVEIKTAISGLRSGDTLVRTLHFKTKKEEYLYELDRNDTHKMLVTLLLADKMKNPRTKARAQKFLDKATALRKKAEEYAANGDYEKAVKICEESTKQIVRAIRSSGFFIPG
ncbi:hypothetical protein MNBD_GAMMA24-2099 [hydrothermal vent metagenome]|uniref:Uncharacterized protein n=1 Tax=hydrothermal vent metagenome TaxID=652676 RepID=A0A3B1BBB2_9ZZZZ